MNATELALRIYEHLRNHPQSSFRRNEFYDPDHFVLPAECLEHVSERKIRTAMENILSMDTIIKSERHGTLYYQYSVRDDAKQRRREERLGILYAINKMQFQDLSFGMDGQVESIHLSETQHQSQWMSDANELVKVASSQRIRLDTQTLNHLIDLIHCHRNRTYARVFLIDEDENRRPEPLFIYPVRIIIQNGYFHCFGIIEQEGGLTGDKFFLDDIDDVETGDSIVRSREFKELEELLQSITQVPDAFA